MSLPRGVVLTEQEANAVHCLSGFLRDGTRRVTTKHVSESIPIALTETSPLLVRLERLGLVKNSSGAWELLPELHEVSYDLKNPSPPDHWKDLTVWFKSQRWSVPLLVAIVAIPIVWQWVEIGGKVGSWVWPDKSSEPASAPIQAELRDEPKGG